MEIFLGIVLLLAIFFVLAVVVGKLKGPPDPQTQSDAWLPMRLGSEAAWINKYLRLPPDQQNEPLKRMFEEKTEYIRQIESELTKRQFAHGVATNVQELQPILKIASELQAQGRSKEEAMGQALIEWKKSSQKVAQTSVGTPAPERAKTQITSESLKRAEKEQLEKVRINLEKKSVERVEAARAAAQNIDVAATLDEILTNLKQCDSLQAAIYFPVSWKFMWSKDQENTFLADVEQEKVQGASEPDAIRAALARLSTR
jgi:hypothetical protein